VYSPAQRAARGLGRRRAARPQRSRLARTGIAAAVIGVAAVAGYFGSTFGPDDKPADTPTAAATSPAPPESAPTTTIPLPIEETILNAPTELVGQAPYLGGPALTGRFDASGVPELGGIYWEKTTGGPTRSAPVVVGDSIVVGGGDGFVWFVDTVDGSSTRQRMSARIDAPVASGELLVGSGPESSGRERAIVAADNSGSVVAFRPAGTTIWESQVGSAVAAAPIITDSAVVVATTEGTIHGLSSGEGAEIWRYPGEDDEPLGTLEMSLAVADGLVFASGRSGAVGIDIATGEVRCSDPFGSVMTAPATVADGYVYTPNGPTVHVMTTGCALRTDGGQAAIQMSVETVTSPAIVGDTMYIGSNLLLAGFSVMDGKETMGLNLDGQITGSPVVADDIIYAGTSNGLLYAVDRLSGEELWVFDTGEAIDAPVAVIDGAVFVLTSAGNLIAIGG
jgi:outer membrane protein assembly factor BamB